MFAEMIRVTYAHMTAIPTFLSHPSLPLVFASVLIDQVGVPVPALPVLLLAGAATAEGGSNPPIVVAVAVAAALTADLSWYEAGRRLGTRVARTLCRISLSPDNCVRQADSLFLRWGLKALVVIKFLPGVAAVATAMAGSIRAPRLRFLGFDVIGATLWTATMIGLGRTFHDAVGDVIETAAGFGRAGGLILIALVGAYVAFRAWRRHAFIRSLRMARISIQELRDRLDGQEAPVILDVRTALRQTREDRIPGARVIARLDEPLAPLDLPHDRDIVIYCACPNEASAAKFALRLQEAGFTRVRPLAGGIDAWRAAGYPLE
jgi:membrane protein DedA with SNARE-associated domain/rhodanese-related sulfurtransferase